MGFFGKLFEKKHCDICGGEIGLLGNRKLEDGNCCKECAKKLSYWFDDRRHSTVDEIRQQIDYRERNKSLLASFHITRTLGEDTLIHLDEDQKKFLVLRTGRMEEENPDIVDFSAITGCSMEIEEDKTEIMDEAENGEERSFDPPRFRYTYNFNILIRVNTPYFDEMRFRLNRSDVEIEPRNFMPNQSMEQGFVMGGTSFRRTGFDGPVSFDTAGEVGYGTSYGASYAAQSVQSFDPMQSMEYRKYKEMGDEIVQVMNQARELGRGM